MAPPTMHQRQALATDHAARYAANQRDADRVDLRNRTPKFTCAPPTPIEPAHESRVPFYFIVAAIVVFAVRYFWGFAA